MFEKTKEYINERIDFFISQNIVKKLDSQNTAQETTTEFGEKKFPGEETVYQDISSIGYSYPGKRIDRTYQALSDLIRDYRRVANFSYVNDAIEEIINDAVILKEEETVKIKFKERKKNKIPEKIKNILIEEFDNVKELLNIDDEGDVLFKNWYIDGRLYMQNILDKNNIKRGIIKLKQMDPLEIKKMYDSEEDKYYYEYNPEKKEKQFKNHLEAKEQGKLEVPLELMTYVHSGLIDQELNVPVSNLHHALRDINRLDLLEDHILIYRIVRAPERRAFYIDVGQLPHDQAKAYINDLIKQYRNKKIFNASTGKIEDSIDHLSMLEDFFLMRKNGKNTEIETLSGGQGLGDLEDLHYFERRVYKALKVPTNRMKKEEAPSIDFARQSEIERDELKFSKFIIKLRKRFAQLFFKLLETQCYLKGLVSREEFKKYKQYIYFDYMTDNYWEEAKDWEKFKAKLEVLTDAETYVGTWFSKEEIHKQILKRTDDDITNLKAQLKKEATEENSEEDPSPDQDFDYGKEENMKT